MRSTDLAQRDWSWANADCMDWLPTLRAAAFRLAILDLPFGTTRNPWDKPLDLAALWAHLDRVLLPNGVVLAFGAQPFTSDLVHSNRAAFRYSWIWEKSHPTGHLNAKKQPMRAHEDVLVFYRETPVYNPQMWDSGVRKTVKNRPVRESPLYGREKGFKSYDTTERYPRSVLQFASDKQERGVPRHPTRKPISLLRYFTRTYTEPGDAVLDPTGGVASTGVAALAEGRRFHGCELREEYHRGGALRLGESARQGTLAIEATAP